MYLDVKARRGSTSRNGTRRSKDTESGRRRTTGAAGGGKVVVVEGKKEKEKRRQSLDLIFRMKDSSPRAFTRSTRAFQHLPEYEQETARDNAEELMFPALYLDKYERRKRG